MKLRFGNDTLVQAGSALVAIEATVKNPDIKKGDNKRVDKTYALMDLVDNYIPEPERNVDKPFLRAIEDVFSITGRGTVVTRKIERGIIKVGKRLKVQLQELKCFKKHSIKDLLVK